MCAPTDNLVNPDRQRKRIVISGAGPAGLLLSSLLLNKNKEANCNVIYDVTLLDGRKDYGSFTKEELNENHRSWMIGLNDHGMDAIRSLPALYENYVKGEGVEVNEVSLFFGKKRIKASTEIAASLNKFRASRGEPTDPQDTFIVDRNFIVAAIARYLKDIHGNDPNYISRYETTCQYVDHQNRRVLVRDLKTKEEEYLDYDLLVGCDGVRSVVREAIVKRHSDFQLEYTDIFADFKGAHLKIPPDVPQNSMCILPDIFPHCQGIALPETGGMLNINIGVTRNNWQEVDKELKSDDYKVVADYFRKNFNAFELVDYEDFAKQWVNQKWNQTGMVHCNFYHSLKAGVVIMGDAAHATSPSLGMGMNTALRDTQIFSSILEETNDDFEKALPAFSEARVKEGNALTALSFHLTCLDSKLMFIETLKQVVRTALFIKFPFYIEEHPRTMVGRRGVPLTAAYDQAVKLGVMGKHREINNRIRMQYFEETAGMVHPSTYHGRSKRSILFVGAGLTAVAAYAYQIFA